jgi:hypothetical protein
MTHLRRSQELAVLARRVRTLVTHTCVVIALLTTLASPRAQAQDVRFHDAHGRVTGSASTDSNGVTTFHDAMGAPPVRRAPTATA